MPTLVIPNAFSQHLADKVHTFASDTFRFKLYTLANKPAATVAVIGSTTPIDQTFLLSDVVTFTSKVESGGDTPLIFASFDVVADGGTLPNWQAFAIFNDTPTSPADPILVVGDVGETVTLTDGQTKSITLDQTNGIIKLDKT